MELGDVCNISRGASPRPISNFLTNKEDGIPWIKIGDVKEGDKYIFKTKEKITNEGALKSKIVNPGDFILSNSMSFGRPYICKIAGCIHDGWLSINNFGGFLNADYLYYLLSSNNVQNQMKQKAAQGGSIRNLNADIVKKLIVTIPTIEKQNKIVTILNRFDSLCNNKQEGLPAEIEARTKQYEYYRDKLLKF